LAYSFHNNMKKKFILKKSVNHLWARFLSCRSLVYEKNRDWEEWLHSSLFLAVLYLYFDTLKMAFLPTNLTIRN
jgi:hypothetical protein